MFEPRQKHFETRNHKLPSCGLPKSHHKCYRRQPVISENTTDCRGQHRIPKEELRTYPKVSANISKGVREHIQRCPRMQQALSTFNAHHTSCLLRTSHLIFRDGVREHVFGPGLFFFRDDSLSLHSRFYKAYPLRKHAYSNILTLRKHAYSNILKFLPQTNKTFQIKNSDIFLTSAQNIDCGVLVRTASSRRF